MLSRHILSYACRPVAVGLLARSACRSAFRRLIFGKIGTKTVQTVRNQSVAQPCSLAPLSCDAQSIFCGSHSAYVRVMHPKALPVGAIFLNVLKFGSAAVLQHSLVRPALQGCPGRSLIGIYTERLLGSDTTCACSNGEPPIPICTLL